MKMKFIGLLVLLLVGLGAGKPPAPQAVRYVSGWRLVSGGEAVRFEHGLGVRPLEVDVWVAHYVDSAEGGCQADFTTVVPSYAWDGLEVQAVSDEAVSVYNFRDVPVCVQVVAER